MLKEQKKKEIRSVAVIGTGTMGPAIAQNFSVNGFKTTIVSTFSKETEKAANAVDISIRSMLKNEFITEIQAESAKKNTLFSTDLNDVSDADLVIEAVPENPKIKTHTFAQLNSICRKDTILASSTSSLNIFDFVKVANPQRLVIAHFNNPANILPVVEIVKGPETGDETVSTLQDLLERIEKKPIVLNRYIPGFICNRLNIALLRECCFMVEQGWISPDDVNTAYVGNQGIKAPFEGPLEMMDYIGWDVVNVISQVLYPSISSSAEPNKFIMQMVKEGKLGVKSGKGLYDYSQKPREEIIAERSARALKVAKLSRKLQQDKLEAKTKKDCP